MRSIIAGLFTSLDGIVSSDDGWHLPYLDDEVMRTLGALLPTTDAMLFGGTTYDEFARQWAGQQGTPSADFFNTVPKYVVTSRAAQLPWGPAVRITGDLVAEIRRLKEGPGRGILVQGSVTLVRTLLREGLLDELNLLVMPALVGSGLRLLDGVAPTALRLADSSTFGNGVIRVSYRPATALVRS